MIAVRLAAVLVLVLSGAEAKSAPLLDDEAQRRLFDLKSGDPALVREAFERVGEVGDERFVAPLIELLRARQIPIADAFVPRELVTLLEQLSGAELGSDWPAWVEWYSGTELVPPPGFTGWKGSLYSRVDRNFGRLLPLGAPVRIRVEEIVWGGVGFEGIPALDGPPVQPAEDAEWLPDGAAVFGLELGGESRAYPLRILDWHELANDELGGIPVSLAWCTLCGSGIAYDRRARDGETYDFGSSGFLMRSNKLMVDRQTSSLWNQLTGEPVVGPLVDGPPLRLAVLPSVTTTWGEWKRRHPRTTVLSRSTGHQRNYSPGAAYADYFASDELMFPVRAKLGRLGAKQRVFGLARDGRARAWALETVGRHRVLNDRLDGLAVVLIAAGQAVRVEGTSLRSGLARNYEAGLELRAYARGRHRLTAGATQDELLDETGALWKLSEEALTGPAGERLERLPGVTAYWFGWVAYHATTSLYEDARIERK